MGLFASSVPAADVSADLVLRGGRVWAGKGLPPATAVAVEGERIVAIGGDAAVRPWIGPRTRVVELRGRLVVPGFNDAHVHFLDGSFGLLSVDLRDAKDEQDFARRIGEQAKKLPKGTWIQNGNWDHQRWPSRREPTRVLDCSSFKPVREIAALKPAEVGDELLHVLEFHGDGVSYVGPAPYMIQWNAIGFLQRENGIAQARRRGYRWNRKTTATN